MIKRYALLAFTGVLLCQAAYAEQDFFGVKMRNELWAKNLVLQEGPQANPNDLLAGPVVDQAIYAEAFIKNITDSQLDFRLNVVNNSTQPIVTDYEYRDYFLYLKDGKKVPLIDPEAQWSLPSIKPKSSMIFNPSLGNLNIRHEDIRMIECSFDLGRTRIFLFPASKKKVVQDLRSPAPIAQESAGAKTVVKGPSGQEFVAPKNFEPKIRKNFEEAETPKPSAASVPVNQTQPSRQSLEKAIQNFKYVPSGGESSVKKPQSAQPAAVVAPNTPIRSEARVVEYNQAYNFITLNAGSEDGLQTGTLLNVWREGKLVGRGRVKMVRPSVSAALLLTDSQKSDIRAGDQVSFA